MEMRDLQNWIPWNLINEPTFVPCSFQFLFGYLREFVQLGSEGPLKARQTILQLLLLLFLFQAFYRIAQAYTIVGAMKF